MNLGNICRTSSCRDLILAAADCRVFAAADFAYPDPFAAVADWDFGWGFDPVAAVACLGSAPGSVDWAGFCPWTYPPFFGLGNANPF